MAGSCCGDATHRLRSGKTVIQHIYDTGLEQVKEWIVRWQSLEGKIDAGRFNHKGLPLGYEYVEDGDVTFTLYSPVQLVPDTKLESGRFGYQGSNPYSAMRR
jgi:hypothetical protein